MHLKKNHFNKPALLVYPFVNQYYKKFSSLTQFNYTITIVPTYSYPKGLKWRPKIKLSTKQQSVHSKNFSGEICDIQNVCTGYNHRQQTHHPFAKSTNFSIPHQPNLLSQLCIFQINCKAVRRRALDTPGLFNKLMIRGKGEATLQLS